VGYATEEGLRQVAASARTSSRKSDRTAIGEASMAPPTEAFDVFLSHSIADRALVRGAKTLIERQGISVYVDWIEDGDLERNGEEAEAAERVKLRMRRCDSLVYLHSANARASRWCPWEVGYFDALKHPDSRIFIFPITEDGKRYTGQSYLALYEALALEDLHKLRDPLTRRLFEDLLGIRRR
jgi:TIR domain